MALAEAVRSAAEAQAVAVFESEAVAHGSWSAATLTLSGSSFTSAASKQGCVQKANSVQHAATGWTDLPVCGATKYWHVTVIVTGTTMLKSSDCEIEIRDIVCGALCSR